MRRKDEIKIFSNTNELFQFAAKDFMHRATTSIEKKGMFSVVLSGGDTPKLFFDFLTEGVIYNNSIPWDLIQFFFGDERYVSFDDARSNYHMAYEHLFSKLPINPDNIYRIPTNFTDPHDAATDYAQTLKKVFNLEGNTLPLFDLCYLGLGDNAHTASLMPSSEVVKRYIENQWPDKNNQLVAALFVPELNMYRITLTPWAINNSSNIIFLVNGSNKAKAVFEVLHGEPDPLRYPAQLIQSNAGKTYWYLDSLAAENLSSSR